MTEAFDERVDFLGETEERQQRVAARHRHLAGHAVESGHEVHVFERGEPLVQMRPIGHVADAGFGGERIRHHVYTVDEHPAGRRAYESDDHLHRRGLARAVRPEEAVDSTPWDVERQFADGRERPVALGDTFETEHGASISALARRSIAAPRTRVFPIAVIDQNFERR